RSDGASPERPPPAGAFLDHAETHRPGQPRRRQAMTRRFLELQQATGVAEQHFALVGQSDAPRPAPEQWAFGLEFETLDLLAYRRLRQVEPFGCTMETAAIGDGKEGAQQLEIQHN